MTEHAALALLYTGGGGPPRAEVLRSVLEGSGIEAYVRGSAMGGMYPTNVGALGEFEIYVKQEDLERARELILDVEKDLPEMALDDDFEPEEGWDDTAE